MSTTKKRSVDLLNTRALLLLHRHTETFERFRQRRSTKRYVERAVCYWMGVKLPAYARGVIHREDVRQIVESTIWTAVEEYEWLCPRPCTRVFRTEGDFVGHCQRRHGKQLEASPAIARFVHGRVGFAVHHEFRRFWKWRKREPGTLLGTALVGTQWRTGGGDGFGGAMVAFATEPGVVRAAVEAEAIGRVTLDRLAERLAAGLAEDPIAEAADALGLTSRTKQITPHERRRLKEAVECDWLRYERTA